MSGNSFLFSYTDLLAVKVANYCYAKKWKLANISLFIIVLGIISPFPIVLGLYFPSIVLRILPPVLLLLFMLMDFALSKLEILHEKQSPINILIPGQIFFFVVFWYEIVLCEVMRIYLGFYFLRVYNIFALGCALAGFLIVFGYLKLKSKPLSLMVFVAEIEKLREEVEKEIPLNYITLTLKFLKRDLIVLIILFTSILNLYLVYFLITLVPIGILGFILYTLILLKISEK